MRNKICLTFFVLLLAYRGFGQELPPVIQEITPEKGAMDSIVTITGENFYIEPAGNLVRFGSVTGVISSGSTTELSVSIPAGADPYGPISVTKLTNSSTAFSKPFHLTFPEGYVYDSTYKSSTVSTGSSLQKGGVGDFDEDGRVDIAAVSYFNDRVYIHFDDGRGGFSTSKEVYVGDGPRGMNVFDYNDDGHLDLITANSSAGTVSIVPGNGDGTFGARTDITVGESGHTYGEPTDVSFGDFNNDGFTDLTVANYETDSIKVLLNNGAGTFNDIRAYYANYNPYEVTVADFDGDGNQDIGVANGTYSGTRILWGDGNGDFSESLDLGRSSQDVAYGDFNGDSLIDIASCYGPSDRVTIFLNNGSRSFSASYYITTSQDPRSIRTADFNGDGNLDIVTANVDGNDVSVLVGDGTGNFPDRYDFTVGDFPVDAVPSDFNNDGKPDLAVPNQNSNNFSILLYEDPYVVIDSVSAVQKDSVSIHAKAIDKNTTYDERGIVWADTSGPTTSDNKITSGSGIGPYDVTVSELTPNTEYFFKAYVFNKDGTFYGNEVSVTTLPVVNTLEPTNIGPTYAQVGGDIVDSLNGNGIINERGVVFDTASNPTLEDNKVQIYGSGTGTFSSTLEIFEPNTTYYVKAYAANKFGTSYGEEYSFTTEEFQITKLTKFEQQKKILPGDLNAGNSFGESIEVHGDLAIVGDGSQSIAHILHKDEGGTDNWGVITSLLGDSIDDSPFPTDVAINQEVAVLGSSYNDEQAFRNGAIYLVYKDSSTGDWDQAKKILPPDSSSYLSFGQQVDIYNNTMAVGGEGTVFIYKKDEGGENNWGLVKKISSPNSEDSYFGRAVAIHEDKLVVGSPFYLDGKGAGFVFYQNQGGTDNWGLVKDLTPENLETDDNFGQSVDVYGGQIIVGATPVYNSSAIGEVYIYEMDQGGSDNWGLSANLNGDGIGDSYGLEVAIENDIALAGAYRNAHSDGNGGTVFVLAKDYDGNWVTSQKLIPEDGSDFHDFGRSLGFSGNNAIFRSRQGVEAPNELFVFNNKGKVPSSFALTNKTVKENEPEGTLVGNFETDVDNDTTTVYAHVSGTGDEDNEQFTIEGNQLLTKNIFNYEEKDSFSIRVNASQGTSLDLDSIFHISVLNVNEPPDSIVLSDNQVGEGSSVGTKIGIFTSIDPEVGDRHTYQFVDEEGNKDNDQFTIEGDTLFTASEFDFDEQNSYEISVKSTDDGEPALSVTQNFTIEVLEASNQEPVVNNPIDDQAGFTGQELVINIPEDLFADPDGDPVSIEVKLPDGSFFKYDSFDQVIKGVPGEADVGLTTIELVGRDDHGASVNTFFDVNIKSADSLEVVLSPTDTSFCEGSTIIFSAKVNNNLGSPEYQWNLNGEKIPDANDDTLTTDALKDGDVLQVVVNVTDNIDEQSKTIKKEVKVEVYPKPFSSLDTYGFIATASPGTKYNWYVDGERLPDSTQSIIAKKQGTYKVEVFNEYGCSTVSESQTIYVTGSEAFQKKDVRIFPNPVRDILNFKLPGKYFKEEGTLTIFNQKGKLVFNQKIEQPFIKINVRHWSTGPYLLNFSTGEIIINRKILKY